MYTNNEVLKYDKAHKKQLNDSELLTIYTYIKYITAHISHIVILVERQQFVLKVNDFILDFGFEPATKEEANKQE